jgi:putative PIN family toxin of toxin-antitoxin system
VIPRPPRRVVIDTNVLLDLWLFDDPSTRSLRRTIEAGRLRPLRSAATDAELADVLQRPTFGLDAPAREALLRRWTDCSDALTSVASAPLTCRDGDDQKFLDAAFSGNAALLLTRDRALLELSRRAGALGLRIERPVPGMSYDEAGAERDAAA